MVLKYREVKENPATHSLDWTNKNNFLIVASELLILYTMQDVYADGQIVLYNYI